MFKTHINRLLLAVVLFNLCAAIGCHRGYYRRQADAEAKRLILEKSNNPRWDSATGNIDINPQSRMFDPFSADHPPLPPDDPTSAQLMQCVDGKEGYPHWHANGDTDYVASPDWRSYLPVNEKGQVVLTLERAYQLALIQSPDLQQQRETLYLSALDVSLERFGFDSQLFTGYSSFFTSEGRFRGGSGSSSGVRGSIGANGGGMNLEKLGITGTNFAVGLANTILFNFAGDNTQSATSLIDFSLIQPLLRGAGRERIMESLTQSERTLLANVRQLERFRRGFYLEIAVGRNAGAGPNRGGNFLGAPGSASSNAGGYVGLLQDQQVIRNQELNVRQLEAVLELFKEFFDRERLDAVQLKNFESTVLGQQRQLLNFQTSYQSSLDQFKLTLGLPPELDVIVDDSYLDQFELVSDQVNERLISMGRLRQETGTALNKIDNLFDELVTTDDLENGNFQWPAGVAELIEELVPFIDRAELTLNKITTEDRRELEADIKNLERKRDKRLAYLENLQKAVDSGEIISSLDPSLFQADSVQDVGELRQRLSDPDFKDSVYTRALAVLEATKSIRTKIANYPQAEKDLGKKALYQYIRDELQEKIPGQLSEMNNLVLEISLLQASARSNAIEIIDVNIPSEQAIEVARCMRRDWMNARASHVDNWRAIDFVADQLEAQVDLVFDGDIGNQGDNPFRLRYENGQLRAGFRFDAPIVRMAERNRYRETLINYQQSRRQFYQFEDSVKRNLRDIVRNLNRNKVQLELDRRQVQVDIEQVEINRYELEKPVGPGGGGQLGSTTANNLTRAIIGLNSSQDSFLNSWVQFEVLRRSLDFDMGTMQLNDLGEWIDPGEIDGSIGMRAAALMGIELDCRFCNGMSTYISNDGMGENFNYVDPSLNAPTERPLESNSIIDPSEVEGVIVPATQLNQPKSGSRQRVYSDSLKSASTGRTDVPNLLFTPVQVRSKANLPSQIVDVPKQSVIESAAKTSVRDNALADSNLAKSIDLSQNSIPTATSSSADRIADKFSEQLAKQASNVAPIDRNESTASLPAGFLAKNPPKEQPNSRVEFPSQRTSTDAILAIGDLRPVPPVEKSSAQPAPINGSAPVSNWELQRFSFGDTLNRFRTPAK